MKHVVLFLIRGYKLLVSPCLPSVCMYSPSCSTFADEAIRRHGVWRGTRLAVTRLLRCWPWVAGGHDPVP